MDKFQRHNGMVILYRVQQLATTGKWSFEDRRRVARLCICCTMTESDLYVYANRNVPASLKLYHEKVGTDHYSVGLYQQQVPSWGTIAACMDTIKSTDKFVRALLKQGLTRVGSMLPWQAIQAVQVSIYPDGSNYQSHWESATSFVEQQREFWTPAN